MAGGRVKKTNVTKKKEAVRQLIQRAIADNKSRELGAGTDGTHGKHRIQPVYHKDLRVFTGHDNAAAVIIDNNPEKASNSGDFASRVLIVAGVRGWRLNENNGTITDTRNLKDDAAGIYVVQKDDPQAIFNPSLASPILAMTKVKKGTEPRDLHDKNKSHVTTYADTIQMVARDGGINLYAGGIDDRFASGAPTGGSNLGINLIFGNRVEHQDSDSEFSLQPLVKGNNLEKALNDLSNRLEDLTGLVFDLQARTAAMSVAFGTHFHFGVGIAAPLVGGPVPVVTTPSPIAAAYTVTTGVSTVKGLLSNITAEINTALGEVNRSPISKGAIKSKWNKTN